MIIFKRKNVQIDSLALLILLELVLQLLATWGFSLLAIVRLQIPCQIHVHVYKKIEFYNFNQISLACVVSCI